jgi:hypothetical protein
MCQISLLTSRYNFYYKSADLQLAIFPFFFSFKKSRDRSVGIALGYRLDDRGFRVRFPAGSGNFFFTTASRTALGPTQPPIQWIPGALSLGVKRPGREGCHSLPSMGGAVPPLSIRLRGVVLS